MAMQGPDTGTGRDTGRERPQPADGNNGKKGTSLRYIFPLPSMLLSGSSPIDTKDHIFLLSPIIY